VGVLLGNGDGTFQNQTPFATGAQPRSLAVADVNGDGKPDLVVANSGGATVSVLLGNGDGTFQNQTPFATGAQPRSLAVADINGDGKPDLIVANENSNSVSALLGNGDGTFQSQTTFATGLYPTSVAVTDLNGDGKPDLVVASGTGNAVSVLLNKVNGGFTGQVYTIDQTPPVVQSIILQNPTNTISNASTANFTVTFSKPVTGVDASDIQAVVTGTVATAMTQVTAVSSTVYTVTVSGVTGSGTLGLNVLPNSNIRDLVGNVLSQGNPLASYLAPMTYGAGPAPTYSVGIADVNGDGKPDIVTSNYPYYGSPRNYVLLGNGDGTFQSSQPFGGSLPPGMALTALGDLNGDGKPDLVEANPDGTVSVLLATVPVYRIHDVMTVKSKNDDGGSDTLRAAVIQADADAANGLSDVINFDPSLSGATITLTTGQLELSGVAGGKITIDGTSLAQPVTISGGGLSRVFQVDAGVQAELDNLTITAGNDSDNVGGGGILSQGTLTVSGCTLTGNAASYYGGGIFISGGVVSVVASTLSSNSAHYYGGGIYNNGGTLTVSSSTLSGNSATSAGGAIYTAGTATVSSANLSGNSAYFGGGIYNNGGTVTVSSSTLSGNSANTGAGIYNASTQTVLVGGTTLPANSVSNSTISGNLASYVGGGIFNSGTLAVSNSILASNSAYPYGGGIFNSGTLTLDSSSLTGNNAFGYANAFNATAAAVGGGIDNSGSGATIVATNCILAGNQTTANFSSTNAAGYSTAYGGGIYDAGAQLKLINCTLSANSASAIAGANTSGCNAHSYGGGIFSNGAQMTVTGCTLYGNKAVASAGSDPNGFGYSAAYSYGGGIYNGGPQATISGCTLASNYASSNSWSYYYSTNPNPHYVLYSSAYSLGGAIYNNGTLKPGSLGTASFGNTIQGVSDNGSFPTTSTGATVTGLAPTIDASGRIAYAYQVQETAFSFLSSPDGQVIFTSGTQTLTNNPAITSIEGQVQASYLGDPFGLDDPSTSAPLIPSVTARTIADFQFLLNSVSLSPTTAIALNVSPSTETAAISAVNSLTGSGTVVLNLAPGKYTAATLHPAAGIKLIIKGNYTNTVIDPDTPALTVTSGDVTVDGLTFVETGNAPTIQVTGGSLTARESNVQGSTTYSDPAIAVSGGSTIDLGTPASPGGNTISVTGTAPPIQSTGTNVLLTQ
jgi:hypothetical protein